MAKKKSSEGLGVNPVDTIGYGWDGQNNAFKRTLQYASVHPGSNFHNPFHWISNGFRYLTGISRSGKSNEHEEALWRRYLGGKKDKSQLPDTKVRFSRDFDKDNKVNSTKEYVGLPKEQKDAIRNKVIPNMGSDLKEGKWIGVKDNPWLSTDQRGTGNSLSGLGKFGLRNNNNSGIYDVVDTYDFPSHIPVPTRNKGYELEIRDTIWTKDAKPELYKQEKGYYPYNHEKNQGGQKQGAAKQSKDLKAGNSHKLKL